MQLTRDITDESLVERESAMAKAGPGEWLADEKCEKNDRPEEELGCRQFRHRFCFDADCLAVKCSSEQNESSRAPYSFHRRVRTPPRLTRINTGCGRPVHWRKVNAGPPRRGPSVTRSCLSDHFFKREQSVARWLLHFRVGL
jgi:hypothetical protein